MIKNISNLGDAALYCDFGDEVNKEINSDVIKYFNSIKENKINTFVINHSVLPHEIFDKKIQIYRENGFSKFTIENID